MEEKAFVVMQNDEPIEVVFANSTSVENHLYHVARDFAERNGGYVFGGGGASTCVKCEGYKVRFWCKEVKVLRG